MSKIRVNLRNHYGLHFQFKEVLVWDGQITRMCCISGTEILVCTTRAHLLRYRWDGTQNRDYCLDLGRIPFSINQQVSKGNRIDYSLSSSSAAHIHIIHNYTPSRFIFGCSYSIFSIRCKRSYLYTSLKLLALIFNWKMGYVNQIRSWSILSKMFS